MDLPQMPVDFRRKMASTNKFTLVSWDGERFEVDEPVAMMSTVVTAMMEQNCSGNDIPIPVSTGKILGKVIDYCQKHVDYKDGKVTADELVLWDEDFVTMMDHATLFDVILVSDFLCISGLLDLACGAVANMMRGKSPEVIREMFHIKNDYTAVEENSIRSGFSWVFREEDEVISSDFSSVYSSLPDALSVKIMKSEQDADIISKLPNEILKCILRLLPFEEAVRASCLSKNWEYLWRTIDLKLVADSRINKPADFIHFLNVVLHLHVNCEKISLESRCDTLDRSLLEDWITAATTRYPKELDIRILKYFDYMSDFSFPPSIFNSTNLTSLTLSSRIGWCSPYCTAIFPSIVCLPSLKHLRLECFIFYGERSTETFFSGCLALETLHLIQCSWINVWNLHVRAQNLWKLEIREHCTLNWNKKNTPMFTFSVPSLKWFSYRGCFFSNYYLIPSPSLEEGVIAFGLENSLEPKLCDWEIISARLYNLLKGFSNVKKLILSGVAKALECSTDLRLCMPLFNNLSLLSFDSDVIDVNSEVFMNMMQNSPCIETLRFEKGITLSSYINKEEFILEPLPACFISSLKRVELHVDWSVQKEKVFIETLEMLLNRAAVLDKLVLHSKSSLVQEKILIQVNKLPRASQVCQIEVVG